MIYKTYSSRETQKLAAKLAGKLVVRLRSPQAKNHKKQAQVIALSGDLGSGKTTFIQGFLKALGVRSRVTSPTFILMKRFPLKKPFKAAYHVDAYRLRSEQAHHLNLKPILSEPGNIVLIEWAEKIREHIPRGAVRIKFEHGKTENERRIKISM